MKVRASITDRATPALKQLIGMLNGRQAEALHRVGARSATERATAYHRAFEAARGWDNPALPTHGPGRDRTGFGTKVADSWHVGHVDSAGATIENDAPHFGFKIRGGTVTPKRVKNLTIPMVPEAHGRRASEYERDFGVDLFTIRGRNGLFAKDKRGSESVRHRTYGKGKRGKVQISARGHIRMIYALVKSVTFEPWKGALPALDELAAAFSNAWRQELIRKLQ